MFNKGYDVRNSSLLPCDNHHLSYEVIRVNNFIWEVFVWAYRTMNVNEFLSPLIEVNSDGYRRNRSNQGENQRSLISSRLRLILPNALGVKKFRYVAYRYMPENICQDGVLYICIEGLYEAQKKRIPLDPENLYIADQMGVILIGEYRSIYEKRLVQRINGQIRDLEARKDVQRWMKTARTSLFRKGLESLTDAVRRGTSYAPRYSDLDDMD